MNKFLSDDFLLETETASGLYHDAAASQPIFDYHTHLSPRQIAENHRFRSISQLWLEGDHYKWRLLRANGIEERFITGDAGEREKFSAWVRTLPFALGNPVYHWSSMELKSLLGTADIRISPDNEEELWRRCNDRIETEDLRPQGILSSMQVRVLCTTDDPADTLEHHEQLARNRGCPARVYPTFRPDRAMKDDRQNQPAGEGYNLYLERLGRAADTTITTFSSLLDALDLRHQRFHELGCRISDHALDEVRFRIAPAAELERVFQKKREGKGITEDEQAGFATALLAAVGRLNAQRGWAMQLHVGAMRDVNTGMLHVLGSDSGFDAIRGGLSAVHLARFLDLLEQENSLPKTIIYPLDSGDYDTVAALIGCFQSSPFPGKLQLGPAWWFNDHKGGIVRQLESTATMGLLGRFIGMVTDSRSFLSFPRHDYFRRILCTVIGKWVEQGEVPGDLHTLEGMIQDICYNNAARYFTFASAAAG